jgi:hypothetical protein
MSINWRAVDRAVFPIKGYDDACRRSRESCSYPFVRECFNFSMPQLADYTQKGIGQDPKGRYDKYAAYLVDILDQVQHAGISCLLDLLARIDARGKLETFVEQTGLDAEDLAALLKYLIYWIIPMNKYLSGLVKADVPIRDALLTLRGTGVRTNLDLLERGRTLAARRSLAQESGLPLQTIMDLVNRADLSRMPWASKATISNIVGAGYGSLASLANAEPQKLYEDFFRYGEKIGKNLKLGNEIENSHRIAKIVPVVLHE